MQGRESTEETRVSILQLAGAISVVTAAVALTACDEGAGDGEATAALPPPPVTVANPLVMPVTEWYEFTGRFEATDSVDVRARVSGYLDQILFQDGQIVEKGEVLFVIDRRPYQARVEQLKAQVISSEAQVELANAELKRAEQLVNNENISRSTYDQRMQQKRAAEAALDMAKAQLREANLDVEFTEVRAPIAGRISDSRVDEGNLVTGDPGATLLTTLVALDPIHFVFDMSESDYLDFQRAVDAGQLPSARDHSTNVQVRLADEPDTETWPHAGHMDFVDNRIDQSAGTIRARAEIPNPDNFITPGQFGQLRLPGSPEYEAILVPESAIVADQSNKMVMTVTGDGTVEPRVIRDGPRYAGSLRIIRRGVEPGDRIIINGLMRARPGAKVDPQPGTIDPPSPEDSVSQG
jgi:RND family efflux transporter MFP subunit